MTRPATGVWGADPRFTWYWDVRERKLVQPDGRAGECPVYWMPLYCVGDMVSLIRWGAELLQGGGTEEEVEQARRWARHMADFKLLAYVTEARDETEVRRIFDRTNTSGRGLSAVDVFHGLYGRQKADPSEFAEDLTNLATDAVSDLQFGTVDRQVFVKVLLAIDGQNITNLRASVHALDERQVARLQTAALAAVRRTIEFLRDDCGIPTMELVPYELAVIVLARFFHLFPDPSPRSRILLRRWLWRGAATGRHAQGLRTEVRQAVRAVVAEREHESVQQLLAQLPTQAPGRLPEAKFTPATVATKLDVLTLASWRPRDFKTGGEIGLADLLVDGVKGATQAHLVAGPAAGAYGHLAANRLLYPGLSVKWTNLARAADPVTLGSHGLEPGDFELLAQGRAEVVLGRRARAIAAAKADLLDSLCEWGRTDRPPIDWLVASGRQEAA